MYGSQNIRSRAFSQNERQVKSERADITFTFKGIPFKGEMQLVNGH